MSKSHFNETPCAADFAELFRQLSVEAEAGRLQAVTFLLLDGAQKDADGDPLSVVDSYGTRENVEVMNRVQIKRIVEAEALAAPARAVAIIGATPARVQH